MNPCPQQHSGLINPYRQNKRCFNRYFRKTHHDNSQNKDFISRPQDFLENVSRASSIKIRQSVFETYSIKTKQNLPQTQDTYFVLYNKRQKQEFVNPQIYSILSKHIQSNQKINKNSEHKTGKPLSSRLQRYGRSHNLSEQKLSRTPKITQFSRQTFYHISSLPRKSFSSKKQKQDNLHSKTNLEINTKKISLFKKTKSIKERNSFITYEIYAVNNRIGIIVEILAGTEKQIKFRLILNQNDTRTFNKFWKSKVDQFTEKCLAINQEGITLKVGSFNIQNSQSKKVRSKILQKVHLDKFQSVVKKQMNRKLSTKKVGNKLFCQQYTPMMRQTQIGLKEQPLKQTNTHQDHQEYSVQKPQSCPMNQTQQVRIVQTQQVRIVQTQQVRIVQTSLVALNLISETDMLNGSQNERGIIGGKQDDKNIINGNQTETNKAINPQMNAQLSNIQQQNEQRQDKTSHMDKQKFQQNNPSGNIVNIQETEDVLQNKIEEQIQAKEIS